MLLSEIIADIMMESGTFITGDLRCIGMDPFKFLNAVVLNELKWYERYRSLTFRFTRTASLSRNGRYVVFFSNKDPVTGEHDGAADAGRVFTQRVGIFNRDPGMIPHWISEVIPTYGSGSSIGLIFGGLGGFGGVGGLGGFGALETIGGYGGGGYGGIERSILHEPSTFMWHYEHDDDHGVLYTTLGTNKVDITAHYGYPIVDIFDVNGVFIDADIKYIDAGKDEIFLDIILGRLLISIGRSRRAFVLNNSPISFDAAELVAEGTELVKEARERLYEQSDWWASIGT